MFHKNFGMRIDLALLAARLAPRVRRCGIDRDFRKGL
jgi:exonuclease III